MRSHRPRDGFILIGVSCIAVIFIIIIVPLISWSVNEYTLTLRSFTGLRALNLADAGAERAVWDILYNNAQFTGWSGTNPKTLTITSFTDSTTGVVGDIVISALNTGSDKYLITSTGYSPNMASPVGTKIVKVKAFPRPLFNNGIFGYSSVSLSGNAVVDSYDSSLGPYSLANSGSNGDIGSNGSLVLADNALVKGDAVIGPTGSASGNNPTHLTGESYYSGNEVTPSEIDLPDYFDALPNLGALSVSSAVPVIMPPGNYCYQSITIDGQATVTFSANTNIYVVSSFTIGGQATVITSGNVEWYIGGTGNFAGKGIVNSTGYPIDLQIYGLGDDSNISYTGLNNFYGVIAVPEGTVYLGGNANFFGAIVGETVTQVGNGQFHYDEALSQNGPYDGYDIAYWQET